MHFRFEHAIARIAADFGRPDWPRGETLQEFRRRSRYSLVAALLAIFLATPGMASAADTDEMSVGNRIGSATEKVFDVVILRPLGVVATAGGFGAFLVAAPLLAPTWEIPYGWDTFVMGPYDYTIERPLGDF
jgi:hypothetical protein